MLFTAPLVTEAKTLSAKMSVVAPGDYTVRELIDGHWFLVTYNEEGYVVDLTWDDD